MHTLTLHQDGHLVIPEAVRSSHHWQAGMELVVVEIGNGIFGVVHRNAQIIKFSFLKLGVEGRLLVVRLRDGP